MKTSTFCHGLLLFLLGSGLSCTHDGNPISPVAEPQKPLVTGKQRLHGYWKSINNRWGVNSCIADTMLSRFVMLEDLDFNFRYTIDHRVAITDSTIFLDSQSAPWFYYRFSADTDTLFVSTDSLYKYPLIARQDPAPIALEDWAPTIRYTKKTWMQKFRASFISAADRYGENWYLHYPAYLSSLLEVRKPNGDTLKTIVFPGGTTSDMADGYLWIAGSYFVERRHLADTSLIERIELSSQYPFQSYDRVSALAVHNSLIYIVIEDHLLCFNASGQLVKDLPTLDDIRFITFVGDKLIAGTNHSTLHTVDVTTGYAMESYTFPESLYGDTIFAIGGVVDLGDRLAAFQNTPQEVYLYEFGYPWQ